MLPAGADKDTGGPSAAACKGEACMPEGAAIGGPLCALVIGVAIETFIGAVILRAAVSLYNKMAGVASSPSGVPEPAFGKAMSITFAISVMQMIAGLIITGLFRGDGAGARGRFVDLVAQLICFPVSLLIMVQMLSTRLPTTLGRAFLVTFCYMLIVMLVVGVLVVIAVVVFGVAPWGALFPVPS
jgi:hypothetical protein